MRICDDIYLYGAETVIETLQRALTFVFMDDVLEPKIRFEFSEFYVTYKAYGVGVCIGFSLMELDELNLTLEQFALDVKQRVVSQFRNKIEKQHRGVHEKL